MLELNMLYIKKKQEKKYKFGKNKSFNITMWQLKIKNTLFFHSHASKRECIRTLGIKAIHKVPNQCDN